MKIEFNALGAVSDIITNDEALRQGNVGANTLTAVFEGKSNLAYTATFNYTRSDDGRLKDIPLTPTANAGEYYYKFSNPWFFALYGETTLTVYLKNSANEIVASGQITFPIEQTDFDDDPNITYSEYELLLDAITAKQDKFNLNNVRGYDTLALATADLANLAENQIVIVKGDNATFYQVQSGSLVELISDKADKDGDGLVIKSTYGVSVVLSYDSATDTIISKLYASDGTLLDTHSAILTKSSSVADGLQSKEHFVKLQALPTNADLTNSLAGKADKATTLSGYGITDAYTKTEADNLLDDKADLVDGKVPSSQLPSYVDDVLEYDNLAAFPETGESDKIYIAIDTNKTYRWSGSAYVLIASDLALGETSSSAYRGDRGKIAYDHSQVVSGNPHNVTKAEIGLDNVDNTSDEDKPISTATKTYVDTQDALKADKLVLTNLISNGDLLIPKASPNENQALGFSYNNVTDISLTNGIATFTATKQYASFNSQTRHIIGMKYYMFARYKTDSDSVRFVIPGTTGHSGSNTYEFVSAVFTAIDTRLFGINDARTSGWTPIEVDYMGAINLTATFGAGNEPTKEQMDIFINKVGFFGSFELDMKHLFELETDVEVLNKNTNSLFTNDIPNSSRRISYYTNYSTGNQISTGAYFEQKIITNPQFSRIITYAVSGDTIPAVIAFYNSDVVFDDTTYMKNHSIVFGLPNNTPRIYYSDVPSGCKAIIITSRNDVVGMETPYTKCSIDYLTKENNYLKQKNIFGKNKQYSHIFINDIYDHSNPKIPCQSSYDLALAKRLGYNIVEANVQKTATAGKYVVMHGVSGTVGGQLIYNNGDSANSVIIANTTFDDLRNNFKYKSIYSKYQTKIISLEEWCGEVKKLGLMPLVKYVDDISLNIVKSYFGTDFILYGGTRSDHSGMIMKYSNTFTKEQMITMLELEKAPMMINVSSLSNFTTDAELQEAIQEVHKRGGLFGICGCYMSGADAIRAYRCGADFSASDSEVNPFDDGDIYNLNGELDFSDFTTNGVIANDTISLTTGQTITVPPSASIPFAHKSRVLIIYNGALTIEICGRRNPTNIISNGEEEIEWSGFAINQAPYLTITATDTTVVKSIRFMAKKV